MPRSIEDSTDVMRKPRTWSSVAEVINRVLWWLGLVFLSPAVLEFVSDKMVEDFFNLFVGPSPENVFPDAEIKLFFATVLAGLACWTACVVIKVVIFVFTNSTVRRKSIFKKLVVAVISTVFGLAGLLIGLIQYVAIYWSF